MRLLFFILLLANTAILGYFLLLKGDGGQVGSSHPPLKPESIRVYAEKHQNDRLTSNLDEVCMEWSGISETGLDKARLALEGIGLKDNVVLPAMSDYWVYVPPLKSLQEAEKKLGEIKALEVDDGEIVKGEGKWRFAISLAAFASKEEAEFHLKQLRDKGIRSAKVLERRPSSITLTLLGIGPAKLAQLEKLKDDFEKSEIKKVACSVR